MNGYGLPEDRLEELRQRDTHCVYCHKRLVYPWDSNNRTDSATIEHLNHLPPWDNIETVAYCCGSCNSSRRDLPILEWFGTTYCLTRGINEHTVAAPVQKYLSDTKNELFKSN